MSRSLVRSAGPLLLVCGCVPALAQNVSDQPAVSSAQNLGQLPRVPGISSRVSELNAGITVAAVHDSYIGWYSLVTPAVSYTFSPHYSADATVSIYPYRLTLDPNASSSSSQQLVPTHGVSAIRSSVFGHGLIRRACSTLPLRR